MEANQILKSDILDILFDGKNKEYGAYELRRSYNRRITIAIISMITLIVLFAAIKAIASRINPTDEVVQMVVNETVLEQLAPDEPPPPPPPPPPKLPPPPPVATVQFTPPKVVKDEEVIKPPPEVKEIEEAKVDVKTVEGTRDIGIVAPPSDEIGTQVVAAPVEKKEDPDRIFTKVEIEASFPGGPSAWQRYVTRAIMAEQDEFGDDDFGTCVVKFIVDRNGTVSDVQATTMKGTKLAEVAVNAIRKGPKWTPAIQNGTKVNAYRLQPVTLTNPDR